MDTIKTAVVNSKAADQHYDDVRSRHGEILSQMKDQALRVQGFHIAHADMAQMEADRQAQTKVEEMKIKHEQAKMQNEMQKHAMEMDMKTKDMEMKRAALSTPQ